MINQIDHIVEHLFNKKKLDDVTENELEEFIAAHPYFAAGHFLLAKKTQLTRPEQTKDKIATAALYYSNALWFQWLLDQDLTKSGKNENGSAIDTNLAANGNLKSEELQSTSISDTSDDRFESESNSDKIEAKSSLINSQFVDNDWRDPVGEMKTTDDQTNVETENIEEYSSEEVVQDSQVTDQQNHFADNDETSFHVEEPGSNAPTNSFVGGEITGHESPSEESSQQLPEPDSNLNADTSSEQSVNDTDTEFSHSDQDPVKEAESKATEESIGKTLSAALIPAKGEIDKNDFVFEPYHTIDYFASQGIKLQQSDLSKDKFGKQLKSFTEWLRSMKRLPQASVDANIDEATQQSIQQVAEHSIEEKEIVTETMAEVWIKQGNREKAIETLHKLSLLNPSKSHYFAAKIEQLKAL